MLLTSFHSQPCFLLHVVFQEFDLSVYDYPLWRSVVLAVPFERAARRAALAAIIGAYPRHTACTANYRCRARFLRSPAELATARKAVDEDRDKRFSITRYIEEPDTTGWCLYQ